MLALGEAPKRILVATDCLSEGINLQEQRRGRSTTTSLGTRPATSKREGRVDRYNQPSETVRVLTYFGSDNRIDGIVLDVLLRKHRAIRDSLGISVPVPWTRTPCSRRSWRGLILRGRNDQLSLFDEPELESERDVFHSEWDIAADREKRSRTVFAQETIKVDEVERELLETRAAIGSGADVRSFVEHACAPRGRSSAAMSSFDLAETPRAARPACPRRGDDARADFELPVKDSVVPLAHIPSRMGSPRSSWTRLSIQLAGKAKRAGQLARERLRPVRPSPRPAALRRRQRRGESDADRRGERLLASRSSRACGVSTDQDAAARLDASETTTSLYEHVGFVRTAVDGLGALSSISLRSPPSGGEALLDAHRRVRRGSEAAVAPTRSSRSSRSTCSGFTSSSLSWTRSR